MEALVDSAIGIGEKGEFHLCEYVIPQTPDLLKLIKKTTPI